MSETNRQSNRRQATLSTSFQNQELVPFVDQRSVLTATNSSYLFESTIVTSTGNSTTNVTLNNREEFVEISRPRNNNACSINNNYNSNICNSNTQRQDPLKILICITDTVLIICGVIIIVSLCIALLTFGLAIYKMTHTNK